MNCVIISLIVSFNQVINSECDYSSLYVFEFTNILHFKCQCSLEFMFEVCMIFDALHVRAGVCVSRLFSVSKFHSSVWSRRMITNIIFSFSSDSVCLFKPFNLSMLFFYIDLKQGNVTNGGWGTQSI